MHMGFLKSWVAGGLGKKVVQRVKELVDTGCKAGVPVKIYVTGGSVLCLVVKKP